MRLKCITFKNTTAANCSIEIEMTKEELDEIYKDIKREEITFLKEMGSVSAMGFLQAFEEMEKINLGSRP